MQNELAEKEEDQGQEVEGALVEVVGRGAERRLRRAHRLEQAVLAKGLPLLEHLHAVLRPRGR